MERSKSLAGLIGPTLLLMVASELKIWNPTLYDQQIVPLVYLSGLLMFVAGLAIARAHNVWVLKWPILITLLAWFSILLGAMRMVFPQTYKANFKNDLSVLVVEIILILIGLVLTAIAYWPGSKKI